VVPTKQRAQPLAPADRRQAILDAVIPLLIAAGPRVTTAEMAEAAGIAEGTIFRVFPDKSSLLHEALKSSFDPAPTLERLANIERALPLEVQLRKAAAIILDRAERVYALAAVLRSMPPIGHAHHQETHKAAIEANSMILWGLTRMFRDEADRLAVEPARAAAAFRGLLHAVAFPLCDPDELITADEAIDVLLKGILSEEDV
jgi:AcrR family transcriptional regulator